MVMNCTEASNYSKKLFAFLFANIVPCPSSPSSKEKEKEMISFIMIKLLIFFSISCTKAGIATT